MPNQKKYDFFISHAFEDKASIADELNAKLREAGFSVWYSGADLQGGDRMEETMLQKIIPQSRHIIIIFSHNYIQSGWTMKELAAARLQETPNRKVIIPLLFNISFDEINKAVPAFENRFFIKATDIEKTIRQLVKICRPPDAKNAKNEKDMAKDNNTTIDNSGAVSVGGTININAKNAAGRDLHIVKNKKRNGNR